MWQELSIIHRNSGQTEPCLEQPGHLWKTCLRSILFLEPGHGTQAEQSHQGFEAHRFLVEICSGLHSPLFGETEVFGQFKAFRQNKIWHPAWRSLLDAVEEDVRKIRRNHLLEIGPQSYGSLSRRHLPEKEPVLLIGAGRLALDLLPWIDGRQLTIAVRAPDRCEISSENPIISLDSIPNLEPMHWLIAAPLSNEQILQFWKKTPAKIVLDFRGESALAGNPPGCKKYFALHNLFSELETVKDLQQQRRQAALAHTAELSQRRFQFVWHRPFGWEDAFA